jgi:phage terminase Nu1 subunit (DNA packaging protein)
MHEFTINRCAEMLEKDRATVARALRNVPPDGGTAKRPLYRLATVASALAAHDAKPDGRHGNGDTARLAAARTDLAREQAEAMKIKNMYSRGELVSLARVQRAVEDTYTNVRELILAVPGKHASQLEMRPRGEVEEMLRDVLYELLDTLADPTKTLPPEYRDAWLAENAGAAGIKGDDDAADKAEPLS